MLGGESRNIAVCLGNSTPLSAIITVTAPLLITAVHTQWTQSRWWMLLVTWSLSHPPQALQLPQLSLENRSVSQDVVWQCMRPCDKWQYIMPCDMPWRRVTSWCSETWPNDITVRVHNAFVWHHKMLCYMAWWWVTCYEILCNVVWCLWHHVMLWFHA